MKITIYAVVRKELGEWIDWWIESNNPSIELPYFDKEMEAVLCSYDTIIVGNKTFHGRDAALAIKEAYSQAA